jgi:1-aminocyclopropane-1-carboxylate deaminase
LKPVANEPQTNILNNYHFGGYAKHKLELLEFKTWFEENYHIELDYVYTAKLFFAAFDLMKQEKLDKRKSILIIHCGGLQGNKGYEERYNLNPKRQVNDAQG